MELPAKIPLTAVFVGICAVALHSVWTSHLDPTETVSRLIGKATSPPEWVTTRKSDKIYQDGKVVADVVGKVDSRET
jgi:hypothetical protein